MVLLVAATDRELCGHDGLVCGVGPVEAAAATARALARADVGAVVHVGIAGGPEPGGLVIGSESVYVDLDAAWPVVDRIPADPTLLALVRRALPHADVVTIGTSAAVGRVRAEISVEAMEGFGVLRAAALAGVPAVEVRAISNTVGEADRGRWRVDDALRALGDAIPALVAAVERTGAP